MSKWMSKDLTLDLIAIAIHSLNKIHQRILEEPGEWPQETPPAAVDLPAAEPELKPAADQQADTAAPAQEAAPEPEPTVPESAAPKVDVQALKAKAPTHLRTISQAEGNDWITGTLFPHFDVTKFTDVPDDRLQELIDMAEAHAKEAAA